MRLDRYVAIASDVQMPGMDGIALLKEIRLTYGDIPFILFSGTESDAILLSALRSGADYCLQKKGDLPSRFEELTHYIVKSVERWRAVEDVRIMRRRSTGIINLLADVRLPFSRGSDDGE
jgi:CheY-like chemotaxis protein